MSSIRLFFASIRSLYALRHDGFKLHTLLTQEHAPRSWRSRAAGSCSPGGKTMAFGPVAGRSSRRETQDGLLRAGRALLVVVRPVGRTMAFGPVAGRSSRR